MYLNFAQPFQYLPKRTFEQNVHQANLNQLVRASSGLPGDWGTIPRKSNVILVKSTLLFNKAMDLQLNLTT